MPVGQARVREIAAGSPESRGVDDEVCRRGWRDREPRFVTSGASAVFVSLSAASPLDHQNNCLRVNVVVSPVVTGEVVGLPPKQRSKPPKSKEFYQIFRMSSPPART